ncbi:MAG: PilZ domain-containing protein [Thermodesulfovibrionales bacterium]
MEKRKSERKEDRREIEYTVTVLDLKELKKLTKKAELIDLSDSGLGIITDYPLEPGHVLTFINGFSNKIGIVRWSDREDNYYRVGVNFV